jgi:ubiquinone/menaquinone biosynthesis C-methylase UbiE
MSQYSAIQEWNKAIVINERIFPCEYVIRIFKGSYPRLKLRKSEKFEGKKVCEVGCGVGRNLVVLKDCGFDIHGVEISDEIIAKVRQNLMGWGIKDADLRVGFHHDIPFDDGFFDFLLSWNVSYYMGNMTDFCAYVKEYARVLQKKGYLVLSIPQKTCFIYQDAQMIRPGYCVIKNDPFKIRNGEVMRIFQNENEIKEAFAPYFEDFIFATVYDDCFGYAYHFHLVVCRKK